MTDPDNLRKELFDKFNNDGSCDWHRLAKHVQRMVIEARIDELNHWNVSESQLGKMRIEVLEQQLKEMGE